MRTELEINTGLTIFYTKENRIYAVQDNYSHSLARIESTLNYLKSFGIKLPKKDDITIQVLAGPRYKRTMSVEFTAKNNVLPLVSNCTQFTLLEENSSLYEWLKTF